VEALQLPAVRAEAWINTDGKNSVEILRDRFALPSLKRRTRDIGNRKRKATTLGKIIVCSWNYRGEVSTYAWLALWVPG
jgi:ribosomal protein L34